MLSRECRDGEAYVLGTVELIYNLNIDMANNYKTQTETFKSLKHFQKKGMLRGQSDYNDSFYDTFAGETCKFAVFEDGTVFTEDLKTQVNPDDILFIKDLKMHVSHKDVDLGCDTCNKNKPTVLENNYGRTARIDIDKNGDLNIECIYDDYDVFEWSINYCPMCGRKLKTDE